MLVAAAACELHPNAILKGVETKSVKDRLRAATDEAAARGVIGVPTVAVGTSCSGAMIAWRTPPPHWPDRKRPLPGSLPCSAVLARRAIACGLAALALGVAACGEETSEEAAGGEEASEQSAEAPEAQAPAAAAEKPKVAVPDGDRRSSSR